MSASAEMPRYQSHKKVWALQINAVDWTDLGGKPRLVFVEPGYASIEVEPELFSRYTPVQGDYYVVYDDGYKSISPAKVFEEGYTRI